MVARQSHLIAFSPLRFGAAGIRSMETEKFGPMVALEPPDLKAVPFDHILRSFKQVPLNGDTIQTGRDIGICFGD